MKNLKRENLVELSKNTPNFEMLSLVEMRKLYLETYGDSISPAYIIKTVGTLRDRIKTGQLPDSINEKIAELINAVGGVKQLKRALNNMP